ncbi:MAG: alpha/beta hydrolase [Candidatus Paceibacterota bacterium]|jgi:hypothetical protein
MKKQVVLIHGGETFDTYEKYLEFLKTANVLIGDLQRKKWKKTLAEKLGENYDVVSLEMPNSLNAKYLEWKIWFEKYIPQFDNEIILVGHSLGGIFLAKYLSENKVEKIILATLLVSPPFDDADSDYSLADFILGNDLSMLKEQSGKLVIFFSKDDPVVPFEDLSKYQNALPQAEVRIFEDRGHFNQEEFPEIEEEIRSVS